MLILIKFEESAYLVEREQKLGLAKNMIKIDST